MHATFDRVINIGAAGLQFSLKHAVLFAQTLEVRLDRSAGLIHIAELKTLTNTQCSGAVAVHMHAANWDVIMTEA